MELEHGIWRAQDAAIAARRAQFFADLFSVVPEFLVIGVTALQHGYAVATHNVKHFRKIPNLLVIPL